MNKNNLQKTAFLTLFSLILASESFAASGAHHGPLPSFTELLSQQKIYWLNFIFFAVLLSILVKKIFVKAWDSRRTNYQQSITTGRNLLIDSENKLNQAKQMLSSLPSEIEKLKAHLIREAELDNKRILKEASERAEKIKLQASETAVVEKRAAINLYQEKLIELAIERARQKVSGMVSAEVDSRLRNKVVAAVSGLVN